MADSQYSFNLREDIEYRPPLWFRDPHVQTMFPTLFRKRPPVRYSRERIATSDGDFLDLDWSRIGSKQLCIVLHGLEGSSKSVNVLGMAHALNRQGVDVLALNYRGCSGVMNRKSSFYHSGLSSDLHTVVTHLDRQSGYEQIFLVGFSIGGNILLKYLGEQGRGIYGKLARAVAISAPINLSSSTARLSLPNNKLYMKRFLYSFHKKLKQKQKTFPDEISLSGFRKIKNFQQYDGRYTAPSFGYGSAEAYWQENSSWQYLSNIKIPTLILSARDDPFLGDECYVEVDNPCIETLYSQFGGHMGFISFGQNGQYWSEYTTLRYFGFS
ncbi:YheT family hydrolase [Pseudomonadota bacterium]